MEVATHMEWTPENSAEYYKRVQRRLDHGQKPVRPVDLLQSRAKPKPTPEATKVRAASIMLPPSDYRRIAAEMRLAQEAIDAEMGIYRDPIKLTAHKIIRFVGRHYGYKQVEFLAKRRTAVLVRHRQIAMYICKTETDRSLPEIGRLLGGMDHTTILHGVRKIASLIQTNDEVAQEVFTILTLLGVEDVQDCG